MLLNALPKQSIILVFRKWHVRNSVALRSITNCCRIGRYVDSFSRVQIGGEILRPLRRIVVFEWSDIIKRHGLRYRTKLSQRASCGELRGWSKKSCRRRGYLQAPAFQEAGANHGCRWHFEGLVAGTRPAVRIVHCCELRFMPNLTISAS